MRGQALAGSLVGLLLSIAAAGGQDIREGALLLADDFDRFTDPTTELGALPQGGNVWGRRVGIRDGQPLDNLVQGQAGQLRIGYSSANRPQDCGVYVDGFQVAEGVISLTVGPSHMSDRAHTACLSYRASDPQAAAGGYQPGAYHVELRPDWSGSRDVVLRYGTELLAAGNLADERSPDASHEVRVAFCGYRHQVWVDGQNVIDYWEHKTGRNAAGHLGFGGYYSIGPFDDFRLSEAIPGRKAPGADPSGNRMGPLVLQGRPVFVLGTFEPPGDDDLAEWLEAGGNTTLVHVMGATLSRDERVAQLREWGEWGAQHRVGMVYHPTFPLFSAENGKTIPTRPEEIGGKTELLREMLSVTADDPWTLGYWTFDEIENHLYQAYGEWEKKRDRGLADWIAETMKWTYDVLKPGDPDGYVMPTIAWWSTYEGLAPLYDVNVPNTYPTRVADEALAGALYEVLYDAVCAADAVRATGRSGFVFMPGIFDNIDPPWRTPTRRELRYCYFAPLTQGAMGLLPWRLGRCSLQYRRAVVYPTMREVKRLVPWLLGECQDGKVSSDRDEATAPYLQEFPARVRLVADEEAAERVEVSAVPDCSYCLRRRPSNSYLLLAVSNRKEPMEVTFTLTDIPGVPAEALELIDYRRVPIEDGRLADTFQPFDVRAYIIDPE